MLRVRRQPWFWPYQREKTRPTKGSISHNTRVRLQVIWEQGGDKAATCSNANLDTPPWLSPQKTLFPNSRCSSTSHEPLAPRIQVANEHPHINQHPMRRKQFLHTTFTAGSFICDSQERNTFHQWTKYYSPYKYYSVMERKEVLTLAALWMALETGCRQKEGRHESPYCIIIALTKPSSMDKSVEN